MNASNSHELTSVDLFTGIGGWAIACHHIGIRTLCFVENDKRCQSFLAKAWPRIPIHEDVNTFDGARYRGADIVFAGVPCQPASRAGKQRGSTDARWLWPQTIAVIGQIQPKCCLFENPPGIEDVGLDGILAQVEAQGYEIGPIFDIPACAVNSPQLRHRYYIVAYAGCQRGGKDQSWKGQERGDADRWDSSKHMGHATETGREEREPEQDRLHGSTSTNPWYDFVWLPCADGKVRRAPSDSFGMVDGLHRSILGALGNSQVPQAAIEICKAIKAQLTTHFTPAPAHGPSHSFMGTGVHIPGCRGS